MGLPSGKVGLPAFAAAFAGAAFALDAPFADTSVASFTSSAPQRLLKDSVSVRDAYAGCTSPGATFIVGSPLKGTLE